VQRLNRLPASDQRADQLAGQVFVGRVFVDQLAEFTDDPLGPAQPQLGLRDADDKAQPLTAQAGAHPGGPVARHTGEGDRLPVVQGGPQSSDSQ
jgi:hypothetical protein